MKKPAAKILEERKKSKLGSSSSSENGRGDSDSDDDVPKKKKTAFPKVSCKKKMIQRVDI